MLANGRRGILNRLGESIHGQSLVELALLLPALLIIMLGVLDLGRWYFAYVTITNASREGARFGMSNSADCASGCNGIRNAAANETGGVVLTANVAVACASAGSPNTYVLNCPLPQPGDRIRVTVQYNFQFATLYLFGVPNITISNYTVMAIIK